MIWNDILVKIMERRPIYPHLFLSGDYRVSSIADLKDSREKLIEDGIESWSSVVRELPPHLTLYVAPLELLHGFKELKKDPKQRTPFYYYSARILVPSVRHSPEFDPKDPKKTIIYDQTGELELSKCIIPELILAQKMHGVFHDFTDFRNTTYPSVDVFVRAVYSPIFQDSYTLVGVPRKPIPNKAANRTQADSLLGARIWKLGF